MVHGKISDCAELKNRINEVGGLCVDMATFKLLYQNNDTQSNLFFVVDRGNYPSLSDNIKTTYKARIAPKVWMYLVLRKKQYQAHEKFIIENESNHHEYKIKSCFTTTATTSTIPKSAVPSQR